MRARQKFITLLAAALILASSFPLNTVRAGQEVGAESTGEESTRQNTAEISEEPIGRNIEETFEEEKTEREDTEESEEEPTGQNTEETYKEEPIEQEEMEESGRNTEETSGEEPTEQEEMEESGRNTEETSGEEPTEREEMEESGRNTEEASGEEKTGQENSQASGEEVETVSAESTESIVEDDTADMSQQEAVMEDETDYPVPDEPPAFQAHIENWIGYTAVGTFVDFTPDIVRIDTLYSLDGENWRAVTGGDWNLYSLGTEDKDELHTLQNQACVYNAYEPMKSYTTGDIDRFYLKLRITKRNGLSYESQSVTIERGGKQPIPEGTTRYACFSSDMIVREPVSGYPYRYRMYGRYQLTVSADATAEDISALLPDTLPVEIQLIHGRDLRVNGVVDCPVTWKPLTLPQLLAGETVIIPDAAEEIIVPAGTRLSTPLGIFELDEPLGVDAPPMTDEVRLFLNVSPEDRTLDGVLKQSPDGLTVALRQKPTGATAIEAYVLTEGESKWTELPGRSLLSQMNAQYATENSGFALVLYNDEEPFCSYLEAKKAGNDSTPFFVGLKIEGGIYDGRQLILAWPDIYEELPDLPQVGRSEGNEGNAGAANKDDSTEGGQRPNLPQAPDADQGEELPADDTQGKGEEPPADDAQDKGEQPPADDTYQEEQPPADDAQDKGEQPPADEAQGKGEQPPSSSVDDTQGKGEQPPSDDNQDKQQQTPAETQTPSSVPNDIWQEEQKSISLIPPTEGIQERQGEISSVPDNGGQNRLPQADTPEIAGPVSEDHTEHSAGETFPSPQETGQRPDLPQTMPETAGVPAVNQENSLTLEPLVVQAAANVKEKETKTAIEPVFITEQGSRAPLLAVTATASTVAVGGCIGAAVLKLTGHGLFRQIAGTIRKLFHRF